MEVIIDEILGPDYVQQPKAPSNVAINSIRSFVRKYDIESPENRRKSTSIGQKFIEKGGRAYLQF